MEGLEQKAIQLLDKLESVVVDYTPKVVDLALNVVRVDAIGNILLIVLLGILSIAVPIVFYKVWSRLNDKCKENKDSDTEMARFFIAFGGLILFIILLWTFFWYIVNVWLWVGLFYPELALAHKLIS